MDVNRRTVLGAVASSVIPSGSDSGPDHRDDVDYGGQDLRNVDSIQFADGSVQETAYTGGSDGGSDSESSGDTTSTAGAVYDVTHPDFGAVGDGETDDQPAIQAAIDAAEADGGGVVYFPPGTYLMGSAHTRPADVVDLVGAGRDHVTITQGDEANLGAFFNDAEPTGHTVEGITFDGNRSANTTLPEALQYTSGAPNGVTVRDCRFVGVQAAVFVAASDGGSDIHCENNELVNCGSGFTFQGGIRGCSIHENVFNGTQDWVDLIRFTQMNGENAEISVTENRSGAEPTRNSIRVNGATVVKVTENVVTSEQVDYDGSPTTGGSADNISVTNSNDVTVSENTVRASGDVGITVENSTDARVTDNDCQYCSGWGVSVLNVAGAVVKGNTCKNNAQAYGSRNLLIYAGISVNDSTDVNIGRNHCYDDQDAPTQEYGLAPYRGRTGGVIVTENILRGNSTGGVAGDVPSGSIEARNLT